MIDTATNMVVATVTMGDDPRGVAVTADGKQTCDHADPGDAGRPLLEDAQRVGTPFPPRDLRLSSIRYSTCKSSATSSLWRCVSVLAKTAFN